MSYSESPVVFPCRGERLVGVVTVPDRPAATGVLVIVGGPQYRVGSHRQFVLLARSLARHGISTMRFDYRGMGDSTGAQRSFEDVDEDIRAAIDCYFDLVPSLERLVLWGLCDGASAASLYAGRDERAAGLVLLNPWVRTESGVARAYLKNYYPRRLLQASFWKKLLSAGVALRPAAREIVAAVRRGLLQPRPNPASAANGDLPTRMGRALRDADVPVLLILSGNDYVANEFDDVARQRRDWARLVAAARVVRIAAADHTFSRQEWRDAVAEATAGWIDTVFGRGVVTAPTASAGYGR